MKSLSLSSASLIIKYIPDANLMVHTNTNRRVQDQNGLMSSSSENNNNDNNEGEEE